MRLSNHVFLAALLNRDVALCSATYAGSASPAIYMLPRLIVPASAPRGRIEDLCAGKKLKRLKLVPFYARETEEHVFDADAEFDFPFVLRKALKVLGYDLSTKHSFEEADFVLLFRLDLHLGRQLWAKRKLENTVYLAMEPPVVCPMHAPQFLRRMNSILRNVLTWQDDLIGEPGLVKFYYPMPKRTRCDPLPFAEKKLITLVVGKKSAFYPGELYSERIKAIRFFESNLNTDFDFYGMGWDPAEYPSWRGPVQDKISTLAHYRFSLSFENQRDVNGLISEKIFDSMLAGCIPVFWGAANVESVVPSDCFVDMRKFATYDALYAYLLKMSPDEYQQKQAAISRFLLSETYGWFTGESFARRLVDALQSPPRQIKRQSLARVLRALVPIFFVNFYWRALNRVARHLR